MTDDQKIGEFLGYFEQYRELKKRIAEVDRDMTKACEEWDAIRRKLSETRTTLGHELDAMKRIITTMIEEDVDPSMAKLRSDGTWHTMAGGTLWTQGLDTYDITVDLSGISLTGAIGATGSIGGPYSSGYPSITTSLGPTYGGAGANGPPGPITNE
jgi:hypothetical protein